MTQPLPVVVFPDAEQVAVTLLRARLPAGTVVGTEWPDALESRLPSGVVSVTRGGGAINLTDVAEDVVLDIDVLAATKKTAHDLAQRVRAHLHAVRGSVQAGARVYGVSDTSLVWLPHHPSAETDPIPRYVLVMSMVIRPA
ncbi:hypothetical protein [Streptomyces candidus]|uniref:Acetylornithine deacetylase/succinyl-diaminopimelate desuccinylase-like protein n=2 Tax=Streptomyces candidus TaxID=67283 RepID=A0A7X0HLT5_9ACTN|nr:hypothetical protein [Streptomyces candidus]MBB6439916.1 acetylornithine deacetylase/succinyl-diaminopimelate desuccinylase-like protein [Streptomyces candidus]